MHHLQVCDTYLLLTLYLGYWMASVQPQDCFNTFFIYNNALTGKTSISFVMSISLPIPNVSIQNSGIITYSIVVLDSSSFSGWFTPYEDIPHLWKWATHTFKVFLNLSINKLHVYLFVHNDLN